MGVANGAHTVDWDESSDISPLGTIIIPGNVTVGAKSIGVSFQANGTGTQLIHSISDTSSQFEDATLFSPSFPRVSVVRPNLGNASSVDILFDSPVRNPTLYGNALGANTLTFSESFTVLAADDVAIIDLAARTITGINGSKLPPELMPNAGGSQEADYQIQFVGTFESLSFTSSRTAGKIDTNAFALTVVPEPASTTLFALVGTFGLIRRRRS